MNNIFNILADGTAGAAKKTSGAGNITPVGDGAGATLISSDVTNIINWIVGILGIVAVVVIIMGGVTYMTSAGDAGKVKKAKDTILYGLIGLVVCALAYAIVNFVITNL